MSESPSPQGPRAPEGARRFPAAPLLVAAVALLAFAPVVTFGFVYDDRWTVVRNNWLNEPLRFLLGALVSGTAQSRGIPDATRPAMVVSLWIDRRLFGVGSVGHHAHSLLLYGGACAAAWFASQSLLRDRRAAVVAACLFAVAPLHAEVVAAVNYREDLIAALGMLVPLGFLFRESASGDSLEAALVVALVFGWGLLAKESNAALVPLAGVLALVLRCDEAWLRLRERTLFLLLAVLLLWLNWRLALTLGGDDIPRAPWTTLSTRIIDSSRFLARSLRAAFGFSRPAPEFPAAGHASAAWTVAPVALAFAIAVLARRVSSRPYALGLCVAAIAPLGASPLVGPVNPWADRYVFVGVLGGAWCIGQALSTLSRRLRWSWAAMSFGAVIAGGVAACWNVAFVWKSERTLWTYAVRVAPDSARAFAALSRVERLDGHLDAADRLTAQALLLNPMSIPARVTGVYNLLARGSLEAARREISYVELLGGALHPGMVRARACARMSREEASRCARTN